LHTLQHHKYTFELILVDDCSNDGSSQIADSLAKKNKEISVIHYSGKPSRRENLAESFKKAKYSTIIFMDYDLATSLDALPDLINYIKSYDIVIGSRKIKGAVTDRELSRKIISFGYSSLVWSLFQSKIYDHQCGFKAFKKNVILDLIKDAGYDHSLTRGWFWDVEILVRAQKKAYKIKEIPIRWIRGEKSSFNFLRELKLIPYMLKLMLRL